MLAAGLAVLATACSTGDGRTLQPPDPDQTTTSAPGAVLDQPSGSVTAAVAFSLTSPAFTNGEAIPARHTCTGLDVSPPLAWTSAPAAAAQLALVVRDTDAAGFVHWIVTGIDPTGLGVDEGGVPEGAVEGLNGTGTAGWFGPCPPARTGTHTYVFALHALPARFALDPKLRATEAAKMIEAASTSQARLTGTATS